MDQLAGLRQRARHPGLESAAGHGKPAALWAVAGGTGGCGKSLLASAMALQSARLGRRVLLVDGDLHLAGLRAFFDVEHPLRLDHEIDPARLRTAVAPVSGGLDLVLAKGPAEVSREQQMRFLDGIVHDLAHRYDLVVMDVPSGFGFLHQLVALHARLLTVVLADGYPSFASGYALIKLFRQMQTRAQIGILFNCVGSQRRARRQFRKLEQATQRFLDLQLTYQGHLPAFAAVRRLSREPGQMTQWQAPEFFERVQKVIAPILDRLIGCEPEAAR